MAAPNPPSYADHTNYQQQPPQNIYPVHPMPQPMPVFAGQPQAPPIGMYVAPPGSYQSVPQVTVVTQQPSE